VVEAGCGQFELQLDLASVAGAGAEPEASSQCAGWTVLPERRSGDERDPVYAGAPQRAPSERSADTHALQVIGDHNGQFRDSFSIVEGDVATDAEDRAVLLILRHYGLVPHMVDMGEEPQLATRQLVLRQEESPAA
jgi:hypothetical protein